MARVSLHAQEHRSFTYQGQALPYLAQNNRMPDHFSFPGMQAYIIIGDMHTTPETLYAQDSLHRLPLYGMQAYACFYYLPANQWLQDTAVQDFLEQFIAHLYERDFINRNKVHLVWLDTIALSCDTLQALHTCLASLAALPGNKMAHCSAVHVYASAKQTWSHNASRHTSVTYAVPGVLDMETRQVAKAKAQKQAAAMVWKHHWLLQFAAGVHLVGSQYHTDFDDETLVDFTRHKTLWDLRAGYYLSDALALFFNGALIYAAKQQTVDEINWNSEQVTINGSGSSGAMLRYGLGIRLLPFGPRRFSPWLDAVAGGVWVMAGGGSGTRTVGWGGGGTSSEIRKHTERGIFYALAAGVQYRLSRLFYVAPGVQYTVSPLPAPVGSVSAFTGVTLNAALGVVIPGRRP
ncbi:hypothetical protein [Chitinophaga japonensis]|uniref:Uncharacterized protein n=1 Tax=Chitinophaga japonensis TaxID=104662 RepID=A0A562TFV3_CHIJA|nr:hypothetical protein [Chitinophaga japonensis]TWI92138.1 hypothetical protein LX66_1521 [Chitinophaga japonensis]